MEPGNLLLFLALVTSVLSSTMFLMVRKGKRELATIAENLIYLSTSLCLAAFLILVYYFLTDTFSIWYVYANSNSEMSLLFKFSAVWAGKEGSLLLWALLNLTITSIFLSTGDKNDSMITSALIMSLFSAYLLSVVFITSNPFILLPYTPYNGVGLNPLLRTFEMVLHPPVVFTAYSLSALLFSTTTAHYRTRVLAKLTWLFFTIGIVIGGWWAYRTLGWGGFWGWDPVENASLLPWIAITVYLHTERSVFINLAFTLTLFAAFVTRSGIISSVHSFGTGYSDFIYILPMIAVLPFLISELIRERDLKGVCSQHLPAIFLSAIAVVFIGTIANLAVSVNREYYLVTFLPIFAILIVLILTKFRVPRSRLVHIGVLLLFIGSASVWLLEQRETLQLKEGVTLDGYTLNSIQLGQDNEKFTVAANITTPHGIIHPEVLIYKIERSDRRVSTVELISHPWADHYFAIKDFNLATGSITLEHYFVPLISLVWVGSIFMIAGAIARSLGF